MQTKRRPTRPLLAGKNKTVIHRVAHNEELFNAKETADLIGVTRFTLSHWLNDPVIKNRPRCLRRGKRYIRFSKEHIAALKSKMEKESRGAK